MTELPATLTINAWTGTPTPAADLLPGAEKWGSGGRLPAPQEPLFEAPADPLKWADENVGYGILLADGSPQADGAAKAAGTDVPTGVRKLLDKRPGTVLLYWEATLGPTFVRRYLPNGTSKTPRVGLTPFGTGSAELPRYVLIVGGPDVIPWSVQYELATRHAVGRLPFTDDRLDNYVEALLGDWAGMPIDRTAPLMWTVDRGGDITAEMRAVIADPLAAELTDPRLPGFTHQAGDAALGAALLEGLRDLRPGLVATSSHGATPEPGAAPVAELGQPVDAADRPVSLADLDAAMPPGAIWYSQACCSAGSAGPSSYVGLLPVGSAAAAVTAEVAKLGNSVAPAPLRLLGREHPVRAVLGHVEPTFDWTLRVQATGQGLGRHIVNALSTNLYGGGQPLGFAFADYRAGVGVLHTEWATVREQIAGGDVTQRPEATRLRVAALDRQSLVLLGDPTVTLPTS
jgi:hypothetical protein